MAKQVFLNGSLIDEEMAAIHFTDLSFQRGYGIFDFFRLEKNQPLFLEEHLSRFYSSAAGMHLEIGLDRETLKTAISQLIQTNNLPGTGVRLSLTGGYSEDGFTLSKPNLLLSQHSIMPPTEEQIRNGIRLMTYPYQRQLPHVKIIDYLMAIWLQPKRISAGADDILYYMKDSITECPRSNFFLVTAENKIVTPSENVLPGITRQKVLQLAGENYEIEERPVMLRELKAAKEAFITSTTKQILPVSQIDDNIFPHNKVSHQLLQIFRSASQKG